MIDSSTTTRTTMLLSLSSSSSSMIMGTSSTTRSAITTRRRRRRLSRNDNNHNNNNNNYSHQDETTTTNGLLRRIITFLLYMMMMISSSSSTSTTTRRTTTMTTRRSSSLLLLSWRRRRIETTPGAFLIRSGSRTTTTRTTSGTTTSTSSSISTEQREERRRTTTSSSSLITTSRRMMMMMMNENQQESTSTTTTTATIPPPTLQDGTTTASSSSSSSSSRSSGNNGSFDIQTALFCGGLAFDAYIEPPSNSSRWERGSKGYKVAFCSQSYTRNLYKGLIECTVQKITGLPSEDDSMMERILTGNGVDACLLVAVLEGTWKEDIQMLEKTMYHEGVLQLSGAAHVGRSTTAWAHIREQDSKMKSSDGTRTPKNIPYHIEKGWGRDAQAIWPSEGTTPFYLYVQDPRTARLVFTVIDDDRVRFGDSMTAIGSTWRRLSSIIPAAGYTSEQLIMKMKREVYNQAKKTTTNNNNNDKSANTKEKKTTKGGGSGNSILDLESINDMINNIELAGTVFEGDIPLTSKPRKRDKNGQVMAATAAGAMLAGPMGAAAGALIGNLYEGEVKGRIQMKIRYLPILSQQQISNVDRRRRKTYRVMGGMPGIDWGTLHQKYIDKEMKTNKNNNNQQDAPATTCTTTSQTDSISDYWLRTRNDLEHCFFVNHEKTGATCAVYRSLASKLIVVSFRGTCVPIDLITDANLVQDAWIEGEDINNNNNNNNDPENDIAKVHQGFRTSMNSISRRLKELILAIPAPGDSITEYDMLVTGHSLGGALATLFTADIGQYGINAGRGLPQLDPSDAWWKSVATLFAKNNNQQRQQPFSKQQQPPRPKTLKLYNFGSPRVGNKAFATLFDSLLIKHDNDDDDHGGYITQAYRIVNGDDVVARMPRTMNALVFGNVGYEHVGSTVLLVNSNNSQQQQSTETNNVNDNENNNDNCTPALWIEGESDDNQCPVRDGVALTSPLAEGSLLSDLYNATQSDTTKIEPSDASTAAAAFFKKMSNTASKMSKRIQNITASDIGSIIGLNKQYTEREIRIIQSLAQGNAIAHHMEDEYYAGMGYAVGFSTKVNEDIKEIE